MEQYYIEVEVHRFVSGTEDGYGIAESRIHFYSFIYEVFGDLDCLMSQDMQFSIVIFIE